MSANDGLESFSSGVCSEPLSSESSLTGVSFSSSDQASSASEILSEARAGPDEAMTMPNINTLVRLSPSLEGDLQSASGEGDKAGASASHLSHGLASEGKYNEQLVGVKPSTTNVVPIEDSYEHLSEGVSITTVELPKSPMPFEETILHFEPNFECSNVKATSRKLIKTLSCCGTCVSDKKNEMKHFQRSLHDKTESESLLKQRLEALKSDLDGAEKNSENWFNQYVKEREKTEQLLISSRDMNSFNVTLRQQIDDKSKIINERDNEIMAIKKSNAEMEVLLQEVKEKLFKANEERERLKMIARQHEEDKLYSKQPLMQGDKTFKKQKPWTFPKFHGRSLDSKKLRDNKNRDTCHRGKDCNTIKEIISCKNENAEFSGVVDPLLDATDNVNIEESQTSTKVNTDFYASDETFEREIQKTAELKKVGISKWLSDAIKQAKAELTREGSALSFRDKINTGRPKMLTDNFTLKHPRKKMCNKEAVKYSLEDILSTFAERIARNVKTKQSDGYDVPGLDETPLSLTTSSQQTVSADQVSTISFESMVPFADVFLTHFECMDFSSTYNLIPLQPFADLFFPWSGSGDARLKQPVRKSHSTDIKTAICPINKVKNALNKENRKTAPTEQKACRDVQEELEETTAGRKGKPSTDKRNLFLREKQSNIPSVGTSISLATGRDNSDSLGISLNDLKMSDEFNPLEYDAKHLITDLRSKSNVTPSDDQRRSAKKHLQLKSQDSTGNKVVYSNNHGFIDSVTVEISLNAEQLINQLTNQDLVENQRPKEPDTKLKSSRDAQDGFNQLNPERMQPQSKQHVSSVIERINGLCLLPSGFGREMRTRNSSVGTDGDDSGFKCKFGAEFTKRAEDVTKRWVCNLLKDIQAVENRDVAISRVIRLPCETSGEALPCVKKEMTSSPKLKVRSNILPRQFPEKGREVASGTETRGILSILKGPRKMTKRDVEMRKRWEKTGNKSWNNNNEVIDGKIVGDGLVRKTGDTKRSNSSPHRKKNNRNDDCCAVRSSKDNFKVFFSIVSQIFINGSGLH